MVVGAVCGYFLIHRFFFIHTSTVRNDVVQGVLIGFGLAFVLARNLREDQGDKDQRLDHHVRIRLAWQRHVPARRARPTIPGPVNVPQEAMYWTTSGDGEGHALSGKHNYVMHFPPGGLPPNNAFWSLTMGDAGNRFVANPIDRYSVSDRTGLLPNADGSIDVFIQNAAPAGHESNWLPAPAGNFILWARVYMPDASILSGEYKLPPIVKTI